MTTLVTRTTAAPRVEPGPDVLEVTYPSGRRCTHAEGCITLLCRYNPGPYCYRHTDENFAQVVAERAAEAA